MAQNADIIEWIGGEAWAQKFPLVSAMALEGRQQENANAEVHTTNEATGRQSETAQGSGAAHSGCDQATSGRDGGAAAGVEAGAGTPSGVDAAYVPKGTDRVGQTPISLGWGWRPVAIDLRIPNEQIVNPHFAKRRTLLSGLEISST